MATNTGYSAKVTLTLVVGGSSHALSHVGPSEVRLRQVDFSTDGPCDAELIITVDDRIKRKHVFLPHGITLGQTRVSYL